MAFSENRCPLLGIMLQVAGCAGVFGLAAKARRREETPIITTF